MKMILLFLLFAFAIKAQTPLDDLRWYMKPNNQEIKIDIDDLHDEIIYVSPAMEWGFEELKNYSSKKEITIAIIDGGVDIEHPDIAKFVKYKSIECYQGNILPPMSHGDLDNNGFNSDCSGWNFVEKDNRAQDKDGHGTHVAGIITSILRGFDEKIKILPLKVFAPNEGRNSSSKLEPLTQRLVKSFQYAIDEKVDVIHLSVGWPKTIHTFELDQVIKKAIENDIAVIAAAGNSSQQATIWPCQMNGVICVGALRANGQVARFSNLGPQVDIFAPGEKILSTIPYTLNPTMISRKGYDYKNGTSQAAPFISAQIALLKSVFTEEKSSSIFARVLKTANDISGGEGLRGMFHLGKSLRFSSGVFFYPQLKGINSVNINYSQEFSLNIALKNLGSDLKKNLHVSISCSDVELKQTEWLVTEGLRFSTVDLKLEGKFLLPSEKLSCQLLIDNNKYVLGFKVLSQLEAPYLESLVTQELPIVVMSRSGAKSRFLTIDPIKNQSAYPIYYLAGMPDLHIYDGENVKGVIKLQKDCQLLRLWQTDLNQDGKQDILVESMCSKNYLQYEFFDLDLNRVFPPVRYKPNLTILNYDDFEIITSSSSAPIFRFINQGLTKPSDDPWSDNTMSRKAHLYELHPVMKSNEFSYEIKVLEEPQKWTKDLKLRYVPNYNVLHYTQDKLLVEIQKKTVWVDIKTQNATWAGLDHILWMGSKRQELHLTNKPIFQSLLTQYEYRGYLLNGITLRFTQKDHFDPLMDVLGTQKTKTGYRTFLRSFQSLWINDYDEHGNMVSSKSEVVDRFDFLTTQDLISSVSNLRTTSGFIQVIDGTKLNTNYVDVITNGKKKSYFVPYECVTQQPVSFEGKTFLPLFCAVSRSEFKMKFFLTAPVRWGYPTLFN